MNFDDRFTDSDVHAGSMIYRCWTCGAVVEDTTRHEEWHQELEKERPSRPTDFNTEEKL